MRLLVLEPIARQRPSFGEIVANVRGFHLANALVSFLFACTGPVALILTVGIAGGLKPAEIASWISIAFGLGGIITFTMSYLYRQPLAMAWTIPGTAIVGAGLLKFPYGEIVGAYVVTGALMLALGLSGAFRKIMDWMPQPIVMAMVAGLFLKFGVLAIDGFDKAPIVAAAATAGFVLFSAIRPIGRIIPPVVAALIGGGIAIGIIGGFAPREGASGLFADLIFFAPKFSEAALLDLVLPLAISVVVLQNAQGIGILRMNRHDPPPNMVTAVCGAGTIVFGLFGAVCTCLTGPANALLASSGEPKHHYIGALIWAGFAILFGLFAPGITSVALAVPDAFIYVIGGLAMLRVLQQSLAAAFGGKFTAGAVVCMVVTVTELIPEARFVLLGIGAPFWGLVFGIAASLLLEPGDFRREATAVPAGAKPAAEPAPPAEPVADAAEPAPSSAEPARHFDEKPERPRPPVPAWALEEPEKPKEAPPPEIAAVPSEAAAPADQPAAEKPASGETAEASPQPSPASEAETKQVSPMTPPADAGSAPSEPAPIAAAAAAPASEAETKQLSPTTPPAEERKEPDSEPEKRETVVEPEKKELAVEPEKKDSTAEPEKKVPTADPEKKEAVAAEAPKTDDAVSTEPAATPVAPPPKEKKKREKKEKKATES